MRHRHPQQLDLAQCDTFLLAHSPRPLPRNKHLVMAVLNYNNTVWPLIHALLILIALSIFSVAQAQTPAQAVGQVETLRGTATAIRGSNNLNLRVGDPILSGDSVETGQASTLGITFLDQTVFSLAANAKMVINDLVYNPQGSSNNMAIKLVQGTFVFLAGRIAPTGNMIIDTPVAQIGIRGTLPWITVGNATSFTILSERDGKTGEYFLLQKATGNVIGTVNLSTVGTRQKLVMNSPTDVPRTVDKTPEELAAEQRFRDQIFDTLNVRDTRLGIAPDQGNQNPPPGDRGGNPPPGDQGSAPGSGPSNTALIDQANAIVAACAQAQAKIDRALQHYYQGNNPQSQQLLLEARNDINRWPPQSCGNLLERVSGGLQTIGQALDDERRAQSAINSCNENEINRLRGKFASSRQSNARIILSRLDAAARQCANRRLQRERAEAKSRANAWCRANKGRGSVAGRIRANGTFSCVYTRKERSRQAWAQCRRQYGNRLSTVKIYNSGRYRCIVRQRQARPQQPRQPQQPQQQHNPTTSAAVIGGILGIFRGLDKKERPSYHND